MVQIARDGDKWSAKEVWNNKMMRCRFSNPVLHEGYIYGLDEGFLVCLDPATGQRKWREGRYGHGQLLLSRDLLVILSETGALVLVEANPQKYVQLGVFQQPERSNRPAWAHPVIANGRLYIADQDVLFCYDVKQK